MSGDYGVGVDLGATNVRAVLADEKGRFLEKLSEKTKKRGSAEVISKQITGMVCALLEKVDLKDVEGVGIGSIGPLDLKRGAITGSPNIPFDFVPLVKPVSDKLKLPTYVLNDCTTAVMGEKRFGAGRNVKNLAYITLSSGIGGGVYVNNHLLLGKDGNASEIGHITIDFEGRLECGCGKRGHWEAYCSGSNIPNFVRMWLKEKNEKERSLLMKLARGDLSNITTKMLYRAASMGDELSISIVEEIGKLNAIGFANVINAYDPSLITVGGSIALKSPDLTMKPIMEHVKDYTMNRVPKIIITPLGEDVVLYGAVAMVFGHPTQI